MSLLWLLKPPRAKQVCKSCGGNFGLSRPHFPFCSARCQEVGPKAEDKLPIDLPDQDLVDALKYP